MRKVFDSKLTHKNFLELEDGDYEVFIDSELKQGNLTYGECYFKGASDEEVLLSCYSCHPSLCNDNLSGVVLLTFLAKQVHTFQNASLPHKINIAVFLGAIISSPVIFVKYWIKAIV